jgi:hypothetical protein
VRCLRPGRTEALKESDRERLPAGHEWEKGGDTGNKLIGFENYYQVFHINVNTTGF